MAKVFDRVGMTTSTTGTGTITLGSAITDSTNGDLRSFAGAGAADGDAATYLIVDGNAWETDNGTIGGSVTTLTRPQSLAFKSSTGSLLNLSGSAKVYSVLTAGELQPSIGVTRIDTNIYHVGQHVQLTGAATVTVNTLYASPIAITRRATFTKIGVNVTTAAGTNARLGIYADGSLGQPGALALDAGTVSTATTGAKEIAISLTLQPGLYWVVSVFDGAPAVTSATSPIGSVGFNSSLIRLAGLNRSFTYAALPATEEAAAYSTVAAGSVMPIVWLRT